MQALTAAKIQDVDAVEQRREAPFRGSMPTFR
ncbi:hypothetical protein X737_18720 [Mesorhizobium sp. L48C026A00]|nr:hypothetical protein X737_18720 [Mesorhizobium sp. L48C026A00]